MVDRSRCTGCSACHDICPQDCIQMLPDREGFLYPVVDEKLCIDCGDCDMVCPARRKESSELATESRTFLAWNTDSVVREKSSSGGIFSVLAAQVLSRQGVVVGAAFDEEMRLHLQAAGVWQGVQAMIGSKYLQSDSRGIFRQVKALSEAGQEVLFTGTPCQIAGLNTFLGPKRTGITTCEIICHGVPSPALFRAYLDHLEERAGCRITEYQFRSKRHGWDRLSVSIRYSNGRTVTSRARACPYHLWFGKHLSVRPSCYQCASRGLNRGADITIGDFWGIQLLRPELDYKRGVSVIMVNSEKGADLLQACTAHLHLEACPFDWVPPKNPCLLHGYPVPAARAAFFEDFRHMTMRELIHKYPPVALTTLIMQKLRSVIGLK